ncbi:hypothetical protein CWI38_0088p0060 [Hamiltosporidium tvaerminnensis]|uniref:Uncharacterized protein n=1 Tax=Hamiltosporidium tvaerminnensis TaxID=1176355 RepID=A0A4Q9M3Z8_9MICR|nr:hypothetical protein CWI38_0088p0060 [Hamiltosporidium tvaerminnensis]
MFKIRDKIIYYLDSNQKRIKIQNLQANFFSIFKETDNECKIKKQSFIYVVTRNNTVIS